MLKKIMVKKSFFYSCMVMCVWGVLPLSASAQAYNERIEQQELELRRMVGEVETLKYENMQLKKDLKSLKSQIDLRFEMMESDNKLKTDSPIPATSQTLKTPDDNATLGATGGALEKHSTAKNTSPAGIIYDTAKSSLDRRDYAAAQSGFDKIIKDYPQDSLTPNAYYWLGETYYSQKNYNKAALVFLDGKRKFPQSPKAGHSLYKLAMSLHFLGEDKEACITLDEVEKTYLPKDASLQSVVAKGRQSVKCM